MLSFVANQVPAKVSPRARHGAGIQDGGARQRVDPGIRRDDIQGGLSSAAKPDPLRSDDNRVHSIPSPPPMLEHSSPADADPASAGPSQVEAGAESAALEVAGAVQAAAAPAAAELSPAASAARLAELFPAVFSPGVPKPLKLRIQGDLQLRAPGVFTRKALSAFLHRHTTSTAYLRSLVNSPHRFDLDGAPAGEVAAEHRDAAAAELQRRRELHEARRKAERDAQREAQRQAERAGRAAQGDARRAHAAEDDARRAHAAEDEQRRQRQALLRAFEASTLSRSNFCALKGLTESELDALLAQARQEPVPAPLFTDPPSPARTTRPGAAKQPPRQRPS